LWRESNATTTAMTLSAPKTRLLARLFEEHNAPRTAEVLLDGVRSGVRDPLNSLFGHPLEDEWVDFAAHAVRERLQKRMGTVYVVTNPVHKDLYKVGMTSSSLEKRLRSLKTAGVVGEFIEVDQVQVLDRFVVERMAHHALASKAERHKEFFVTDWRSARLAILEAAAMDNHRLLQAFKNRMSASDFTGSVFLGPHHGT
jgi:hypothetical protein